MDNKDRKRKREIEDVDAYDDDDDEDDNYENAGEESESYIVEAIRKWRYNRSEKRREFYIKWSGYDESENTWEPEENLNCERLLKKFKKRLTEDELRNLRSKDPQSLSGLQRNAKFVRCLGADGPHESDSEESSKPNKQKFYLLIQFDDSDTHEEVALLDFLKYYPREAFKFVESRLYVGP